MRSTGSLLADPVSSLRADCLGVNAQEEAALTSVRRPAPCRWTLRHQMHPRKVTSISVTGARVLSRAHSSSRVVTSGTAVEWSDRLTFLFCCFFLSLSLCTYGLPQSRSLMGNTGINLQINL